jgi:tetratricopeptide (TPR) repeat protein
VVLSLGLAALGSAWVLSSGILAGDPKVQVFSDALVLAQEYPLVGLGRFAFGFVFSRYQSFPEVFFVRSAESWPLSLLAEVGAVGLLFWLAFVGLIALSLARRTLSPQERWLVAGLFGLWVHEFVDFSLDTAGVGAWAALLLGSLVPGTIRKRAVTWAGVVLGSLVLLGGVWGALHPPEKPLDAISTAPDAAGVAEAAREALSLRPADGYAALAAAERLVALREPKEALRYINRARYLIPQDPRGHLLAARALRLLGRRAQARSEYRAAIEYPVALGGRHHPEWLTEALQIAPSEAEALELAPRASSSWPAFAQELAGRGRSREARSLMQRFTWREPKEREGWFLLHRFALSLKENALAEEAAAQLQALGDPRGVLLLAQSYEARGEKEKAAQAVAEGRARYPKNSALQLAFGKQALSQGDTASALQAAQTVRELGEQIAESWALEGAALAAQSRYQGAAKAYQEALTFAPSSRAWRAELARIYERLGRRSAALEMYRALRSEDPSFQREIDRLVRGE